MPKVVDHEAYRQELTTKAVAVFTEHGYHGLGMRGIAEAMGVSKSALYHYFPSKKALFEACTEFITQPYSLYGQDSDHAKSDTIDEPLKALLTTLDNRFRGEMVLLLDYVKDRDSADIQNDPLLRKADQAFLNELTKAVGTKHSEQAYALMMGGLLLRLFNGNQTTIDEIQAWIEALVEKAQTPD
ncbi:TetR/AcrR family transcriptional regulator [Aestuariirhabdus sp. Z084]|uniref:TetR/AcrR family transcriptional regulator n=1 Tax=Aestuariirhabdus haliotis TaxID=2918751 RepID=UPI00201B38EB|nr:TetR/AcrR family transcriptional regulator [Aestuariirhabdus haliotis]MCL6415706.1 TetR/AcrR family transcriptional regulator [Aestuariirhabdus haliotis]MCL6419768.1 TetR/AcrR family transcriptional regulator [Aestuariirhabdus haliotis]